ncbi:MAG TPA: hypothetical protein VMV92_14740 [Streptosporangiaceae bacterium]|nr:hypothetical protein [Streptosporangiaceae bacterium]
MSHGGTGENQPQPAARVDAERQRVFDEEVRDAVAYERGLAVKCLCCIILVARVYFFG